ncbi:hypothetical protein LX32DRAFT_633303 [Colletotrichum zoysiae]|uniref:Uncharacterized protein n=1 Tax=Colletotrichum zoysiae TaxID=1216348 RepID=A0AAD9HUX6_9PEZI|nr:hypothetical protein LX32DRAFT_633303 [Colletotrichum zoysiae]
MRTSRFTAVFGLSALALAQSESLAPSPTESWGCQPHGDHWVSRDPSLHARR